MTNFLTGSVLRRRFGKILVEHILEFLLVNAEPALRLGRTKRDELNLAVVELAEKTALEKRGLALANGGRNGRVVLPNRRLYFLTAWRPARCQEGQKRQQ